MTQPDRLRFRLSRNHRVVAILTLAQVALALGLLAISPLTPFVQGDLGLTRAQVGIFVSVMFLGAGVLSYPTGRMVDRYGPRPLILAGLLILGVGLIVASFASSLPWMLVLLAVAGMGQGVASPALTTAVSLWVPAGTRGTAMGIKQSGVPGGAAIGAAILPTVAVLTSWRFALRATGLVIIVIAVVTAWLLDHYASDSPAARKDGVKHTLRAHVWRREIFSAVGAQILLLLAQFAFVSYFVLHLTETLSFTPVLAGLCLALGQAGAWVGRISWGVVSDRLLGGNWRITLGAMALGAAAFALLISLMSGSTPLWAVILLALGIGLTGVSWAPTFLNGLTEMAGPAMAGTAVGVGVGFGYSANILGTPLLGYLADWTGSYRATWQFAAGSAFAAFLLILVAGRPKRKASEESTR